MTTVTFPSEQFPGYPTISVDALEGWQGAVVPGMVISLGRATEPGVFRPNVIVAVSRFAAGYELQTAIDAVLQKFSTLQEVQEIGRDVTTINGHEWSHIESSFIDPRAGTLVQASHVCVVTHGPVADLVQITGTVTATQAHDGILDEIRAIQRSAKVSA